MGTTLQGQRLHRREQRRHRHGSSHGRRLWTFGVWRAWWFCAIAFLVPDVVTAATGYEVSGTVTHRVEAGPMSYTKVWQFTVAVAQSNWLIRLVPVSIPPQSELPPGAREVLPDYKVAACDGHRIYSVDSFEQAAIPRSKNRGFAQRRVGHVPFGLEDEFIGLWYTFASGAYLATNTSARIVPLARLVASAYRTNDFRVEGRWELQEEAPWLPRSIVASNYIDTVAARGLKHVRRKEASTNVALQSSQWRTQNGLTLPYHCVIEHYPSNDDGSVSPKPWRWIEVQVEKFQVLKEAVEVVPRLPDPSIVQDLRFLGATPSVVVDVLTNRWPSDTYVEQSFKIKSEIRRPRRVFVVWQVLFVLVVFLGPAIFTIVKKGIRAKGVQQ